jgi:hypothetical protein
LLLVVGHRSQQCLAQPKARSSRKNLPSKQSAKYKRRVIICPSAFYFYLLIQGKNFLDGWRVSNAPRIVVAV